jgi:hypothetical protein
MVMLLMAKLHDGRAAIGMQGRRALAATQLQWLMVDGYMLS